MMALFSSASKIDPSYLVTLKLVAIELRAKEISRERTSEVRKRVGHLFCTGPLVALIGLIYLFAYVDADFVIGGKGLF
jgi:hypothetical protein